MRYVKGGFAVWVSWGAHQGRHAANAVSMCIELAAACVRTRAVKKCGQLVIMGVARHSASADLTAGIFLVVLPRII
jgi:hypothetical protein